jgi:putative ABC transport system permease protein
MIWHLLRLVWNRKRTNALLTVEIAVSFLVLFVVVLLATYYADNYRRPIGFDYDDVWLVSVDVKQESDDYWDETQAAQTHQLELALRDLPVVESVAAALTAPFTWSYSDSVVTVGGKELLYGRTEVTDELADALRLDVKHGRFFTREDDAAAVEPIVVDARFARELYGTEDVVGTIVRDDAGDERELRIVGVVADYRKDGELSSGQPTVFHRAVLTDPKRRPPRNFVVRTRPGTPPAFEEKLVRTLEPVAPDWSFEAKPLAELHDTWLRVALAPLIVIGLVAAFLMIMVGLGLMGVLWQNVTQRRQEIGLRRVQGATAGAIHVQFLGELLVVCTFGLVIGSLLVVQAPLFGLTGPVGGGVFASSMVIAAGLIYLLTVACGLYPSWMATRVEPVQALRYE